MLSLVSGKPLLIVNTFETRLHDSAGIYGVVVNHSVAVQVTVVENVNPLGNTVKIKVF